MKSPQTLGRRKTRVVPVSGVAEIDQLRERVVDLEGRLRALAVSRRVLISLLVSSDRRRKSEVAGLRLEVEKLRGRTARYHRALSTRDAVIHRLRHRLDNILVEDASTHFS